jgi:hypothetical protein
MSYKKGDAYRLTAYFSRGNFKYDDPNGAVALELVPQIIGLKHIYVDLEGKKPIYYIRREFDFNISQEKEPIEVQQTYFIGYEGSPKKLLSIRVSTEIQEIEDDFLR